MATWLRSCSLRLMFLPSMWKNAYPARLATDWTAFGSACAGSDHTPPRFASSRDSSASSAMRSPLFAHAAEVVVVVFVVVHLAAGARDDPARPARALTRRLHRVFLVVAALLLGQ